MIDETQEVVSETSEVETVPVASESEAPEEVTTEEENHDDVGGSAVSPPAGPPVVEPEVTTLGATGSVVDNQVSPDQLSAVIAEAVAADVPAKVVLKSESDLTTALNLIELLNPDAQIGVVVKETLGGRATWRRLTG